MTCSTILQALHCTPPRANGASISSGESVSGVEKAAAPADLRVIDTRRQGDEDTFRGLVDKYQASLGPVARLYVPNRAVADDVVQDTWMGVIQGIGA